jgi:hypothetical protein
VRFFTCTSWTAGLLAAAIACECSGQELSPAVAGALRDNAETLGPITVVWTAQRECKGSPTALLKSLGLPEGDLSFFEVRRTRYVYDDGKTYTYRTLPFVPHDPAAPQATGGSAVQYATSEASFDGEKLFATSGKSEDAEAVLSVNTPASLAKKAPTRLVTVPGYFREAGFALPSTAADYERAPHARSWVFVLCEAGKERVESAKLDGVACLKVSVADSSRRFEFYLDPTMHYAVRRRDEKLSDGKLALRSTGADFSQVPETNLWLPRTCQIEYYTHDTKGDAVAAKPIYEERISVEDVSHAAVDGRLFSLDQKLEQAGTVVLNRTLTEDGSAIRYVIPADRRDLDRVIAAARKGETYVPEPRGWLVWLMAFNFVLFTIIVGYALWRSYARAQP